MREYKIHDDGCDELLVDGFCHRCGFSPDMQSTAWVSAYPARRDIMKERDRLAAELAQVKRERDEAQRAVRDGFPATVEVIREQRDSALALLAAARSERDEALEQAIKAEGRYSTLTGDDMIVVTKMQHEADMDQWTHEVRSTEREAIAALADKRADEHAKQGGEWALSEHGAINWATAGALRELAAAIRAQAHRAAEKESE